MSRKRIPARMAPSPGPVGWCKPAKAHAGSSKSHEAGARTKATNAARRLEVERLVTEAAAVDFPGRDTIPALRGGAWFRLMCDRTGHEEAVLMQAARTLGLWPWTVAQVVQAFNQLWDGECAE